MSDNKNKFIHELEKWAKKKRSPSRALFLAQRENIEAALQAGYTVKMVWEHLRDKHEYPYSYQIFSRLVREYTSSSKEKGDDNPKKAAVDGKQPFEWKAKADPKKLL